MKPITVYFDSLKYLMYQEIAKRENKKTAELIREAADLHLDELLKNENKTSSLDKWEPISLGGLKEGGDWLDKDYQDEMLGEHF